MFYVNYQLTIIGSELIYNGLLVQNGTDIERIAISGSKISRVITSSSTAL
ncbi:hypothetical protein KO527_14995 [Pseudoalteromonas sp. C2R02]|nr:hypothetical protein [Pseudoalteromonas sp. C2R02]MBU2970658.1 hypothetical protein [Pseudoalteromonas sp. C2R02]